MGNANIDFYYELEKKVKKNGYSVISIVPDNPLSSTHFAYSFTLGMKNFGMPELFFVDSFFDVVEETTDNVLNLVKNGMQLYPSLTLNVGPSSSKFKLLEMESKARETLTTQAKFYYEVITPKSPDFDVLFVGFEDEFGVFPDEKIFIPSETNFKQVYKSSEFAGSGDKRSLVMPAPSGYQA